MRLVASIREKKLVSAMSDSDEKQCTICKKPTLDIYFVLDDQFGGVTRPLCSGCQKVPGVEEFLIDMVHSAKFLWCCQGVAL